MTTRSRPRRRSVARHRMHGAAATTVAVTMLLAGGLPALGQESRAGGEQFRPLVHYSPTENWMNDPNGMVYVDGAYHLFYQHNPQANVWGNMSWGHAISPDLLHWEEQPLAIPQAFDDAGRSIEDIFSGSIVIDENNSAGFGPTGSSPLVAIYTSAYTPEHPEYAGLQAQSLAYSLDDGQTWKKYDSNPVLNRNSANFRDPKVFWYDGPAGTYWVMVAVEATDHQVVLYKSTDLRSWEHLSDFGPANATDGIWECPDLFELPVDGDPDNTKWVMVVNLNPGHINGGSGGQYFVGDFDGVTFTSESTDPPVEVPEGEVFASFDEGDYEGWTVSNEPGNWAGGPWGSAPATGTLDGQSEVTGFVGTGLVNGFLDHDWPVGSLESPTFTVDRDYINFLVGGGKHPHVPGGQLENDPPAGTTVFDFEGETTLSDSGWELTGDFALDPTRNPSTQGGEYYLGDGRINTFEGGPNGDDNTGTMTSPRFDIDGDQLSFLIGGGQRGDGSLQAELLIDGQVVRTQTGQNDGALQWSSWDVAEFRGQQAQLRIRDEATGGWGHLTFDHLVVGDEASQPRSSETSINLMVDGRVVRTATGADSEHLDWKSWNVAELVGQEATIRIVDNNRGAWGHILADQVTFADAPVPVAGQGYDWLDWGRDYYAAVSYSGTPSGSRLMQAWMNNWEYAGDIPTSPWRSSMTLPREVVLVTTPAGPRLQQRVVSQISGQLDVGAAQSRTDVRVDGATALELSGDVAKLDITLRPGDADQAGITVFSNGDAGTRIGYDVRRERIFIDRTASGNLGFSPAFASVDDAPLALEDGTVTLEVYLDRASVELFAAEGLVTLTDQVFPEAGATSISAWSDGGTATIEHITVTPLMPTMWTTVTPPEDGEPSITLSAEAVEAGDAVTVSGTRFHAGESLSIELRSAPVEIGTTTTDEHGAFSRAVKIPVDTPIGPHAIVVTRSDGSELTLPLIVTTAEGESDEADGEQPTDLAEEENLRETSADDLARTGDVPPWRILAIGTLLTVLGTVFMQRRRRAR